MNSVDKRRQRGDLQRETPRGGRTTGRHKTRLDDLRTRAHAIAKVGRRPIARFADAWPANDSFVWRIGWFRSIRPALESASISRAPLRAANRRIAGSRCYSISRLP